MSDDHTRTEHKKSTGNVATDKTQAAQAQPAAGPAGALLPAGDPDRWELGREIARGGMGRILAAPDRRLGRQVAIKGATC